MRRVQIEPMPGEPAIAHAGRIALFLGVSSTQKFDQWLKREWNQGDKSATSSTRLAQLAGVAGMSLVDYARQHSLMGVLRVGARPSEMALHGAPEATNFTKRLGMLTQKKEAFLCPRCVQEDLEHWKFSWFRRTHQLQGVDWCPSHRTPLVKVKGSNPWERLPQHRMEKGEVEGPNLGASDLESNDFVLRFTEIGCALLERSRPLHLGRLAGLLCDRAREIGLRTSQDGVKPNLSDLVLRSAPEEWLMRHWPDLVDKKPGSFYFGLDNTLISRTVSKHPKCRVRQGETLELAPFPYIGDLLLFIIDAVGPYAVNWTVKDKREDFHRRGPTSGRPQTKDVDLTALQRHAVEATYYQDAGIPTQQVAGREVDSTLRANLHRLFLSHSEPVQIVPAVCLKLCEYFQQAVGGSTPAYKLVREAAQHLGVEMLVVKNILEQGIWNRRIRADLFEPLLLDRPLKPQRDDPLDVYKDWFARGAL